WSAMVVPMTRIARPSLRPPAPGIEPVFSSLAEERAGVATPAAATMAAAELASVAATDHQAGAEGVPAAQPATDAASELTTTDENHWSRWRSQLAGTSLKVSIVHFVGDLL